MWDYEHTGHLKGRKVLLETPSGFAMFVVMEHAFKENEKNIWVLFSDPEYAIQVLVALGFRKIDNKSIARDCNDGPGKDLSQLIHKFCKEGEKLIVQDKGLKASIEKNLKITCICDGYTVGELMWGIKNVLHKFVREEGCNITKDYCLPVSEGLQEALRYYLVNISPTRLDKSFISQFGFLCYLDLNLETYPKELARSFDEYVRIREDVEDDLDYAKVLALVLVPELVEKYNFPETFSSELASKLQEAKKFQDKRRDDLTMPDIEKIMGILNYLRNVPERRDQILMDVKLMEAALFRSGLGAVRTFEEPLDFNDLKFRMVLLETPSGFAIFNVREYVFSSPENIWKYFSDIRNARNINSDSDFIYEFGYMNILDILFEGTSKVLHNICDQYYVSSTGGMKDDVYYACKIAKDLFPGLGTEIELSKIAAGWETRPITCTGKAIADDDKPDILKCLERLMHIYRQRSCAEQHLDELRLSMITIEGEPPAVGRDSYNGKQLSVEAEGTLSTSNSCNGENVDCTQKDAKQLPVEAVDKKDGTLSTSDGCNGGNMDRTKKDGKHLLVEAVAKKDATLPTSALQIR